MLIEDNLYEKKVLPDREFPMQLFEGSRNVGELFSPHWHEHIEIHQIMAGEADFQLGRKEYHAVSGDILIANSNELHAGYCVKEPYVSRVLIFDISDLSEELGEKNIVLNSVVRDDAEAYRLMDRLFGEFHGEAFGSRQICRGLTLELLVHLSRHHLERMVVQKKDLKRKQNMERLNGVLCYIMENYTDPITNSQLANMMYLSEDRFSHLFRESIGVSPLQYVQELRLQKALQMLQSGNFSVTQVASAVGFQDYNNFGRLFRRSYGCTPIQALHGAIPGERSGIV